MDQGGIPGGIETPGGQTLKNKPSAESFPECLDEYVSFFDIGPDALLDSFPCGGTVRANACKNRP
jgi:hypothetical protein